MHSSILLFQTNFVYIRELSVIHSALKSLAPDRDLSDILRAQLLMAVSALDHFVHNSVEEGMLEIYLNIRTRTTAFEKFHISMKNTQFISVDPSQTQWFKAEIQEQIGYKSFQKAGDIKDIIKLISDKTLWNDVSVIMNENPDVLKNRLNLIIDRRNIIAHQADNDPNNPGTRNNITQQEVENIVDFIDKIADSIFQVTK